MSLTRSIALQGIGYATLAIALQGFAPDEQPIQAGAPLQAVSHFHRQALARRTETAAQRRASEEAAQRSLALAEAAETQAARVVAPQTALVPSRAIAHEPTITRAEPQTVTEHLAAAHQARAAEITATAQALADKERANQNRAAILTALLLASN